MIFLSVNGEDVAGADSSHPVLSHEFLSRKGIFETLRVYSGHAFKLRDHIARLQAAATRLGISIPGDVASVVENQVARACAGGLANAFLRVTLTEDCGASTLVTMVTELPNLSADLYKDGIRVVTSVTRRNEFSPDAGIKTTSYLVSLFEFRAAVPPGTDDALLLDTSGHLSEGSASNVFLVVDGTLLTPPTSCGALPGITRATVIDIARKLNVVVEDSLPIDPSLTRSASEIFLTSSVREIVPVAAVDDHRVGLGVPGIITRTVMSAFRGMTA